jgi:hypothetical protein
MKHATWLLGLLSAGVVFVLWISSSCIQPIDLSCGQYLPLLHEKSQLTSFISKALYTIQDERHPLCVLEVGTADGTGTTVSLFNALQEISENEQYPYKNGVKHSGDNGR